MSGALEGPGTAIVTGGARRIGAAITRALAAEGWHVLIHHLDSGPEAQALAEEAGTARTIAVDLAAPDCAETVFAALDGMPPPRLLVNNASRFVFDAADAFGVAEWDAHHAVNVRAPALLSQHFARIAGSGSVIVNLLDAKLAQPNPDFFSYTCSKMGLAGLTELTARAFAPRGIRVCGIAPAVTLLSGEQRQDNFAKVHALNPLGRGVTPDDIVAALRFILASPVLTGHVITLDAGQRFLSLARDVQFLETGA